MRIIRLKIKPDTCMLLDDLAKTNGFDDPGFVQDLYAMLRFSGRGLPDARRLDRMAESVAQHNKRPKIGVHLLMAKRKMVLQGLAALPYFKALSTAKDVTQSIARLLKTFQTMFRKTRQAQCMACSLRAACAFGQQYGEAMRDITKVIDPDFSTKVHEDCPHLPEIGAINQLGAAVNAFQALASAANQVAVQAAAGPATLANLEGAPEDGEVPAEDTDVDPANLDPDAIEDNYSPFTSGVPGKGQGYLTTHTGQHICRVTEETVDKVTAAQLLLFELGRNFDMALSSGDARSFKPVREIEHDQKPTKMESMKDVTSLVSSQHGLPAEVFDARADKKQLNKISFQKPEKKQQLLYLLIDSSGSMGSALGNGGTPVTGRQPLYTRAALATVFSLALMRKIKRDGGIVYLRFFENSVSRLYKAAKPPEFDAVYQAAVTNNYNGWGTQIQNALTVALSDIATANTQDTLAKAEILLITDCDDSISVPDVQKLIDKREVNVLDVGGGQKAINQQLKDIATKYLKVNESAPDIKAMVQLL